MGNRRSEEGARVGVALCFAVDCSRSSMSAVNRIVRLGMIVRLRNKEMTEAPRDAISLKK